jgi:pimeloyl-ACP methyl ester carboxylesterase
MHIHPPQKISIQGIQLEIQRISGTDAPNPTPLVFLHEGLGSVAMWRDWPARLCQRLGCAGLVYSRRGYGQSDAVPDVRGPSAESAGQRSGRLQPDYMHHEALTVLPALLQALGIARPVLLGHSDGGTIALLHASRFEVAGCVVMAPHVMAKDAYENGPLRQRLAPYHADVDCAFWQWNDVWLSEAFRSFDIRPELGRIAAPLLAIQGESDPYGTMAQIDDIARAVPHAQRLKLPDCGHSPHRDLPEAVAQAVQAFMGELQVGL